MTEKFTSLEQITNKYNVVFSDKQYEDTILKIYNGDFNENDLDMKNPTAISSVANYYMIVKQNPAMFVKYCKILVDMEDVRGHTNLGRYYLQQQDYDNAVYHNTVAHNMGCVTATHNLGVYYSTIKNDDETAIKYFNEAIEQRNMNSLYALINYHSEKGNQSELIKLLINGIEFDDIRCYDALENMLLNIQHQINYQNTENNLITRMISPCIKEG